MRQEEKIGTRRSFAPPWRVWQFSVVTLGSFNLYCSSEAASHEQLTRLLI